jgi:hypothetical protein
MSSGPTPASRAGVPDYGGGPESLTVRERQQVKRLLGNPLEFPSVYLGWLESYLAPIFRGRDSKIAASAIAPSVLHTIGATGEPGFQNGWVNYGVGYQTAGFYKDSSGVVHLTGLIKAGTANTTAFTLPVGFRPAMFLHFPAVSNSAFGVLRIDYTGTVAPGVEGSTVWYSLDGVSFRAA